METHRTRICICYLITAFLISLFIYTLISNNLQNMRRLGRLKEEVDEIAHVVLHSPSSTGGESKQLTDVVDAILKKRLAGIWDDLYTVKKQLKTSECSSLGGSKRHGAVGEKIEERINYASEELGAKIHSVIADPVGGTNVIKSILGMDYSSNPPVNILRTSMEPGSCFAFKDSKAEVTVKLAKVIYVESVELEHISKGLSPTADTSSAPKVFSVYGIDLHSCDVETLLGTFDYDNGSSKRIQSYPVKSAKMTKFHFVRFKFEANHGNPNFTCVYRVAIYGRMQLT